MDAHEILPNLWQGSAPPLGGELAARGFRALVLCAKEHQPPAARFPGVAVCHAPNDDTGRPPTREELAIAATAARWVAEHVVRAAPVLVTCWAGRNRSGLVSALALQLLTGEAGAACARRVQRCRPNALTNRAFVRVLDALPPIPGSRALAAKNLLRDRLYRFGTAPAWLRGIGVGIEAGGRHVVVVKVAPGMTVTSPGVPLEVAGVPVRIEPASDVRAFADAVSRSTGPIGPPPEVLAETQRRARMPGVL